MIRFNLAVLEICRTFDDYGPEVRANYKGALLNRARIFIDDLYQDIFSFDGNHPVDELFSGDTIIEMEEMPPSEINMPAFIISMVLQRLRAHRFLIQAKAGELERAGRKGELEALHAKHPPVLLVIEEAHNVLHRRFETERSEREAGKGKRLIEQVGRLMMEGRSLGIGLMVVDQSPKNLADAVIANANTKLVFRQEDGDEVKAIGSALGIPEKDWPDLQRLEDGECVVKCKAWPVPVKLAGLGEKDLPQEIPHLTAYAEHESPRYGEMMSLLQHEENGWTPPPSKARALAKGLLHAAEDRMDVVRFILGKHWIEAGDHGRAAQVMPIADYGVLFRHLQYAAKPNPDMAEFLVIVGMIHLGADPEKIRTTVQAMIQRHGADWLLHVGDAFLRELCNLVQEGLPVPVPEGHDCLRIAEQLRAWIKTMTVCSVPGQSETQEGDAVLRTLQEATRKLDSLVRGLLATAFQKEA